MSEQLYIRLAQTSRLRARSHFGSGIINAIHYRNDVPLRFTTPKELSRLAAARSRSRENDTQSFSNTLAPLRYFSKAEATAKAKYERLVKFVDFYS